MLKRQCHEIFDHFWSKNSTWAPNKQAKRFREIFCGEYRPTSYYSTQLFTVHSVQCSEGPSHT